MTMKQFILIACCLSISLAFTIERKESDAVNSQEIALEETEDVIKRETTIGGSLNKDRGGYRVGGTITHNSGSGSLNGHVDYSKPGGTNIGIGGSKTWNHGGGSKTSVSGNYNHNSKGGNNFGIDFSHTFGKRLAELEQIVQAIQEEDEKISKRETTIGGSLNKDRGGYRVGGTITHNSGSGSLNGHVDYSKHGGINIGIGGSKTWDHGRGSKTSISGRLDHSSKGGNSIGIEFSHTFGKRLAELEQAVQAIQEENEKISKRETTIGGSLNKDRGGYRVGGTITHNSGSGSLNGHVDYSKPGGTNIGIGGSKTWNHGGGSKTSVSGGYNHNSKGGNSFGIDFSHTFGKRLAELEQSVQAIQEEDLKISKRETTIGGSLNKDRGGYRVGGTITHNSGSGSLNGHVDYSKPGGTNIGIDGSKTWNHGGGSKTSVSGNYNHNSKGGNNFGIDFSHTFGKRLAELEQIVQAIQEENEKISKRETTIGGSLNKDRGGYHVGGTITHNSGSGSLNGHVDYSKPGGTNIGIGGSKTWNHGGGSKTSVSGNYNHNSKGGNRIGIDFSHTFGKRLAELEQTVQAIQEENEKISKRETTIGGSLNKDRGGFRIGGTITHNSGSGSLNGHVDYSKPGGTNIGIGGSKTWNHGGGSKTSVSGNYNHNSKGGNSFGIDFSHTFGKRLAELEQIVQAIQEENEKISKRETTIGGSLNKDRGGYRVGGTITHNSGSGSLNGHVDYSKPGGTNIGIGSSKTWNHGGGSKTSVSGNYNHNSKGGNSFGIDFSHTFGKRLAELEQTVQAIQEENEKISKRETTIGGSLNKDRGGYRVGGTITHNSGSGSLNGHVDYSKPGGTNIGIGGSKTWNHGGGSKTSVSGSYNHNSKGGNSFGIDFSHTFGKRLAELEQTVQAIQLEDEKYV